MHNLNKLEKSIVKRILKIYPGFKFHLPFLRVASREITGVGMYINFVYLKNDINPLDIKMLNLSLSNNEIIQIEGLEYGLGYEAFFEDGRLKFIELVTYGEDWTGNIPEYFYFKKFK